MCWVFPVCWEGGVLQPAGEAHGELVCAGTGLSLYASVRDELRRVFGDALIHELDAHQASVSAHRPRLEAR